MVMVVPPVELVVELVVDIIAVQAIGQPRSFFRRKQ
jgi:hypothetical protein